MLRRLIYHRPSRKGLVVLILLLPALVVLSFYQTSSSSPPAFILEHPYFQYDLDALEPRDGDHQRCVLPRIHPFHPSIWGLLSPPRDIVCVARGSSDLVTVTDDGWLKFNQTELEDIGYEVDNSLKCHWSKVERGGISGNVDEIISYGKESHVPKGGLPLPEDVEILRVVCRNFAKFSVYDKLHARIRDVRTLPSTPRTNSNFVNVLVFGVDSMSRLSFIRHLPLTYKYLTEDLKMTVLRGMNKVGDNSFPNLIALLTGKAAYGGDLPDSSSGFDDWPLIWKNYSDAGYATLWAEDFPEFGLFNYLAAGFREPPTLHYLRPFWLAMKESPLLKISSHLCYGKTPRYLLQMEYLRQFISVYGSNGIPFFGFSFLAELSHDYISRISSADIHFRNFFQWLADSGQLDNTLLFVMSDHGHRFNVIRSTRVGQIEERTPFHAVRIPMTLTSRQPEILANLLANSGRLVTPYDVYATLTDLLAFVETGSPLGVSPSPPGILGTSLFSRIPANRTCKDASVPGHYCVCETVTEVAKSDARVRVAAQVIVDRVNYLLKDEGDKCRRLTVGNIVTSQLVKTMEEEESTVSGDGQRIRVVVEAEPSLALFEATVILSETDGGEVWGDVSRINQYAGQDTCIRHAILRKYCFCVDQNPERDVVKL